MAAKDVKHTDPKPLKCSNCAALLGEQTKVLPVMVDDDTGHQEPWCPQCFVFHRSPLERGRWSHLIPIACGGCGVSSVSHELRCLQCKSKSVIVLVQTKLLARA